MAKALELSWADTQGSLNLLVLELHVYWRAYSQQRTTERGEKVANQDFDIKLYGDFEHRIFGKKLEHSCFLCIDAGGSPHFPYHLARWGGDHSRNNPLWDCRLMLASYKDIDFIRPAVLLDSGSVTFKANLVCSIWDTNTLLQRWIFKGVVVGQEECVQIWAEWGAFK